MHTALAQAAAKCTGSWQQQWNCGWKQPTTTAANAGYFAGHNVAPFLILGAIIGLILIAVSKSRSSTPAANSN